MGVRPLTIPILIFVLSMSGVSAQVDYLKLRDRYQLSCRMVDSVELSEAKEFFDSIAQFDIRPGLMEYYSDHAFLHYLLYLKYSNLDDLKMAANSYEYCYVEYHDLDALWSLGMVYGALGDCKQSLWFTELYLEEMPDAEIDYKQVYLRYKRCLD
jgi:hypothetical protein